MRSARVRALDSDQLVDPDYRVGEGEDLGGEGLGEEEAAEREAEAETSGAGSPARRALLDYLLGP